MDLTKILPTIAIEFNGICFDQGTIVKIENQIFIFSIDCISLNCEIYFSIDDFYKGVGWGDFSIVIDEVPYNRISELIEAIDYEIEQFQTNCC